MRADEILPVLGPPYQSRPAGQSVGDQINAAFTFAGRTSYVCIRLSPQARATCQQGCDLANGNTFLGDDTLMNNTTGSDNIALGDEAGRNLTTGDHNIDIGNRGAVAEASTIRTGRVGTQTATYVAGISGATVTDGIGVVVGADGHLGTVVS